MALSYTAGKVVKILGTTRDVGYTLDGDDLASLGRRLDLLIQSGDIVVAGEAADKRRMAYLGVPGNRTNKQMLTTEMYREKRI